MGVGDIGHAGQGDRFVRLRSLKEKVVIPCERMLLVKMSISEEGQLDNAISESDKKISWETCSLLHRVFFQGTSKNGIF